MKLRELLEICNKELYLMIDDGDVIITDTYTQIDDYFSIDGFRHYDNRTVEFIDSDETDISNIPTLFISI